MVQDWVPARTSLASGIVIKQTTLERNKYPVPQLSPSSSIAFYGSGSTSGSGTITWSTPFIVEDLIITGSGIQMYQITGSSGGTMPDLFGETSSFYTGNNVVNITQSWTGTTPSLLGPVAFTQSSQTEFFDGELSGSNILVTNGDLNGGNPFLKAEDTILFYTASYYNDNIIPVNNFLDQNTSPNNGEIYLLFDDTSIPSIPFNPVQ